MKNYLIIGGSSGIGKELALLLAGGENQVYATFHRHPPEEKTENLHYYKVDVQEEVLDLSFLPEKLDGFVYCPGSINLLPFARIKPADFVQDFQLQVVGAVKVLQTVLPLLKKSEDASIVLFSTIAAQLGFSFHTQVATSKGAIEGLTKALAAELAPGIRVNAIAPSITDTPLASKYLNTDDKRTANAQKHPLKRIGTTLDLAEMAAFLLSEKSSWMTGQILHLDGGLSSIKS